MIKKKKVLVTGAAGFAGSHIIEKLINLDFEVTGTVSNKLINNISHNYSLIQIDLSKPIEINSTFDIIIHCAARTNSLEKNEDSMINDNVIATLNIINFAKKMKINKLIYLSSVSIYGTPNVKIIDENSPAINPDIYGTTKYLCEQLLFANIREISSICLRLPALVGKNSKNNWPSNIFKYSNSGEQLILTNENSLYNNLLHIDDLSNLIIHLLNFDFKNFEILTVASQKPIKIKEVLRLFKLKLNINISTSLNLNNKKSYIISTKKLVEKYSYSTMEVSDVIERLLLENI